MRREAYAVFVFLRLVRTVIGVNRSMIRLLLLKPLSDDWINLSDG